jgi:hypothetical protein
MKRCPQCDSLYNDEEHFCELDGTPLTQDAEPVANSVVQPPPQPQDNRGLLLIGGLAGVILGMLLFLLYFALTWEKPKDETSQSSTSSISNVIQPPLPLRPAQALPEASPSPSVEASPSPSVEPSPSVQASQARIELSSNPISTAAGGRTGPVIIRLQNGLSIEAEEAWQTGEGIWYRKSGVVSLLDPSNVKAIEKVPAPSPQPSPESSKQPQ